MTAKESLEIPSLVERDDNKVPSSSGQDVSKSVIQPPEFPPGEARLKPQYVIPKRPFDSAVNDNDDSSIQPPPKKKSRGQNKYRPPVKIPFSSQLCPTFHIGSHKKCQFGEKCRYLHDIPKFIQLKPPDINNDCYVFDTYGYCPSGLACRYGNSHIDSEMVNVINKDKYNPDQRPNKVMNTIPRTLQEQLRKKKIPFPRTDLFLKTLNANKSDDNSTTTAIPMVTVVPMVTNDATISSNDNEHSSGIHPTVDSEPEIKSKKEDGVSDKAHERLNDAGLKDSVNSNKSSLDCDMEGVVEVQLPHPPLGPITDEGAIKLRPSEKKQINFKNKLYLAPLTTVGNLPYRRICKKYGVDITCSEMALSINLLQGQQSEWALLKRHKSEDLFGIQVCGSFPDTMTRCAELISNQCSVDFIDINTGCPIDLIFKKGAGCALMQRKTKFQQIVTGMSQVLDIPLTVKMRTGVYDKNWNAHKLVHDLKEWGASLVTIHGRSREQRYTKLADWDYIDQCAKAASPMPIFGNGDILSFEDYNSFRDNYSNVSGVMIARGALIKPWIFTEIKEQRHWDISSSERLTIVKDYVDYGLEHWGSDTQGVERTRRFLLEWLSFLYRYIPYGLLERTQKLNERPPSFIGRDDLETLMASRNCKDWIKISEMFLGPIPDNFAFLPKHKANSYS